MTGQPREVPAAGAPEPSWLTGALLVAAALPLALVVLEAYRVLTGPGPAFLPVDQDGELSAYARLAYFVRFASPDRSLVLPLVALGVVAWRIRTGSGRVGAVRATAVALTALLGGLAGALAGAVGYLLTSAAPVDEPGAFYLDNGLGTLGAPLAAAVLLVVLSLVTIRVLLLGVAGGLEVAEAGISAGAARPREGEEQRGSAQAAGGGDEAGVAGAPAGGAAGAAGVAGAAGAAGAAGVAAGGDRVRAAGVGAVAGVAADGGAVAPAPRAGSAGARAGGGPAPGSGNLDPYAAYRRPTAPP